MVLLGRVYRDHAHLRVHVHDSVNCGVGDILLLSFVILEVHSEKGH